MEMCVDDIDDTDDVLVDDEIDALYSVDDIPLDACGCKGRCKCPKFRHRRGSFGGSSGLIFSLEYGI